ncbi:MAG: cytidylate kinase family protein [Candidatus Poseidoniales archaeon]|nr:cytidylate kinase family protein [Candidatus Poseidoniales archaeon]
MSAKVTISGHPGSGTSTLVNGICKTLNWQKLNGGQVFRNMAEERGLSLEEFSLCCMDDDSVDQSLDRLLVETMVSDDSPEIVESRLAGWWAYKNKLHCPRVWIDVSERVRAGRVVNREGGSIDEQLNLIRERMEYDGGRYTQFYDIDINSHEPYTCVIDSDAMAVEDVLIRVLQHLEEFN